jgi:uncharacterized protein (TIGR03118 family)
MKSIHRTTLVLTAMASAACSAGADPSTSTSASDMGAAADAHAPDSSAVDSGAPDSCMPPANPATIVQLLRESPIVTNSTDPNLINPWGLNFSSTGIAWISDNGTGVATAYTSRGAPPTVKVTIPAPPGDTAASTPTGNVANTTTDFMSDKFIFATEDGTIAGWQSGTTATLRVNNTGSGAVYKGLAMVPGSCAANARLYAANFHAGTVDVFDGNYTPVRPDVFTFVDNTLPAGFAPFNISASSLGVIVAYALQDDKKHDDVPGAGNGLLNLFDNNGRFITRLASGGVLNAPWGMTMSPPAVGAIGDRLIVGNFGDGHINVFVIDGALPRLTADFVGAIGDVTTGQPFAIDGLWGLRFGNDQGGFSSHTLYFTAGPAKETQGIFGQLALP